TSLARALVLEPKLLLLDEPFSALDPASRRALLCDFQRIVKETGITTVFVTHDRDEAFTLANRVGVLDQGYLLQIGSRENVFYRPETEAVAKIVGIEDLLSGVVETSDGDYVTIRIGDRRVHAKGRFSAGTKVVACIRPEEVSFNHAHCEANGLNRLKGRIVAVSSGMTHHRVIFNCGGFDLIALLDRMRYPDRDLSHRDELTRVINATAVHVRDKGFRGGSPREAVFLYARRLEVLQVDEALRWWRGRFEFACFSHKLNDLAQSFHIQFALLGNNAAIRVEIERQGLADDRFGRSRGLDGHADDLIAVVWVAH